MNKEVSGMIELDMDATIKYLEKRADDDCYESRKLLGRCLKCNDTGKLYGAQNYSDAFIKKNGTPYYTADCDCQVVR